MRVIRSVLFGYGMILTDDDDDDDDHEEEGGPTRQPRLILLCFAVPVSKWIYPSTACTNLFNLFFSCAPQPSCGRLFLTISAVIWTLRLPSGCPSHSQLSYILSSHAYDDVLFQVH